MGVKSLMTSYMGNLFNKMTGDGEKGYEYYTFQSDPSKKVISNSYYIGEDGGRIAVNKNPDMAAIQQADEQRLELQKKTGKKSTSILGGGLY